MPIDGQKEKRRLERFTDKFGRLYEAETEIATGDPCQVLRPLGWSAPQGPEWFRGQLIPPCDDLEVVRMVPRLYRAIKGYSVEIDFVRWLQKWDEAEEVFLKKIADFAHGMAKGDGERVLAWIDNPPAELRKLVGNGPRRIPRAFIEAAAAGNQWALGLSDTIPKKAEALLRELEPIALARQHRNTLGFDPLADDDETADERPVVAKAHDPLDDGLDDLLDLEEQHDPKATGGTKVPPPRRRRAKVGADE